MSAAGAAVQSASDSDDGSVAGGTGQCADAAARHVIGHGLPVHSLKGHCEAYGATPHTAMSCANEAIQYSSSALVGTGDGANAGEVRAGIDSERAD